MTVRNFFDKYLNVNAIITLADERGNILYEGRCGDAPFHTWRKREVVNIEGLGMLDDIIITIRERAVKA